MTTDENKSHKNQRIFRPLINNSITFALSKLLEKKVQDNSSQTDKNTYDKDTQTEKNTQDNSTQTDCYEDFVIIE